MMSVRDHEQRIRLLKLQAAWLDFQADGVPCGPSTQLLIDALDIQIRALSEIDEAWAGPCFSANF